MLKVETDATVGFLELTVDGAISREEYEAVVTAVDELLKSHDKLNVVEVVKDLGWIEPEVWWKDILFHLSHRTFLHRVAVVSDRGWVGPLTRFFAPLYPAAIRTFGEAELAEARRWAKVGDVTRAAD
jgi:hypothetical protein